MTAVDEYVAAVIDFNGVPGCADDPFQQHLVVVVKCHQIPGLKPTAFEAYHDLLWMQCWLHAGAGDPEDGEEQHDGSGPWSSWVPWIKGR